MLVRQPSIFWRRSLRSGACRFGFFAGWLTPFAFACGLFALALFAFLAAMYMTVDTHSEPDLQDDFRRRAIWAQFN
jgi:cytochrome bd ubiquinol oxidase subunit II